MASHVRDLSDLRTFADHLQTSNRILALCGAGLSASSGLPTFRGAGGLWRNLDATSLATPEAFQSSPALIWQFYSYRRHMALQVKPNAAHFALAELARRRPGFVTLTQNVDGLSQRAEHPSSQLHLLHGSLFDLRCSSYSCDYSEKDNFTDPIVPSLAIPRKTSLVASSASDNTGAEATSSLVAAMAGANSGDENEEADISDATIPIREVPRDELPQCPKCHKGLLRPGVVWFGETLPQKTISAVNKFVTESTKIDLMLVIGTSAMVFPAASYINAARHEGAKVAVINMDRADGVSGLCEGDWFFEGDAAKILPEILEPVIGDVSAIMTAGSS